MAVVEQNEIREFYRVVDDAAAATDALMDAVLRAKEFQERVDHGERAYEKAGFEKWADCERHLAEEGFKRAPRDFRALVRDAKLFPSDFVRQIGPSKLKAAARVKRAGRWNENWENCFLQESVAATLERTRDELRKVYEDRKWVRMLLPRSLAEAWDAFRMRIRKTLAFETDEQVLDWTIGFWTDVPDEEIVFLTEHGFGGISQGA